jgi:predicted Zn-dependent protease
MMGAVATLFASSAALHAQERISFIRDAEIESTIRAYATPIFNVTGLDPAAIRIYLVNDRTLNAFVAGGLNLFINTGLLMRADDASQVIGVIAHETGHISGGHLARQQDIMRGALAETILAMVLGGAAAAAGGNLGATLPTIAGALTIGERSILRYSREMESAADQAGVTALERSGQSARGMYEFLKILADEELIAYDRQDPYLRSHPITRERVDFVRNFLTKSKFTDTPTKPEFVVMHKRMRAKLLGYLDATRALQVYRDTDTSMEARYARAYAYSRIPDYPRAFGQLDSLIKEFPNDAYFLDAKGGLLIEAGRPKEAVALLDRAVKLKPNEPLIRTALGQAQVDSEQPELLKPAIENLEIASRADSENGEARRLLSIAYSRNGQIGLANLAQAERAVLSGKRAEARNFATRAMREVPEGSPAWLRAQDVLQMTERNRQ